MSDILRKNLLFSSCFLSSFSLRLQGGKQFTPCHASPLPSLTAVGGGYVGVCVCGEGGRFHNLGRKEERKTRRERESGCCWNEEDVWQHHRPLFGISLKWNKQNTPGKQPHLLWGHHWPWDTNIRHVFPLSQFGSISCISSWLDTIKSSRQHWQLLKLDKLFF